MEFFTDFEPTGSIYLNAAIIFVLSLIAAKAADLAVTRGIARLAKATSTNIDDRITALLHRPLKLTFILFGAGLAAHALGAPRGVIPIVETVLVILWLVTLLQVSTVAFEEVPLMDRFAASAGVQFGPLVKNFTIVVLVAVGVMGVLDIWGISITPLLASAGIIGAAVAFAAKDTIANFLGGVSILFDRPYTIGHYIVLESGERGEVVDIGLRSTRIKTRDDILITVPNSIMSMAKIINESAPLKRFRVRIPVGVAYGSDVGEVERILLGVASGNAMVEREPEPRVRFRAFGDSSLDFELLCWADDPMNRGKLTHELNRAVYEQFMSEGITIPFPQRDVYLHSVDGGTAS